MASRQRMARERVRSVVLTLRLTNEEMLRFKVAALSLKTHRAKLVRERVADLIGLKTAGQEEDPTAGAAVSTGIRVPVEA